jgi:hypothetical protein
LSRHEHPSAKRAARLQGGQRHFAGAVVSSVFNFHSGCSLLLMASILTKGTSGGIQPNRFTHVA